MSGFATNLAAQIGAASSTVTKVTDTVSKTQGVLHKTSDGLNLSGTIKSELSNLQRTCLAGRTAIRAIPPIPAGPAGPVITLLKKTATALLVSTEKGVAAVKKGISGADTSLKGARKSADSTIGTLSKVMDPLSAARRTLKKLDTVVKAQPRIIGGLSPQQQGMVMASAAALTTYVGELEFFEYAAQSKMQEIRPLLDQIETLQKEINAYGRSLSELVKDLKGLTRALEEIATTIRDVLKSLPGWAADALAGIQAAIQWVLEKTGIQYLINKVGALAQRVFADILAQLNQLNTLSQQLVASLNELNGFAAQANATAKAMTANLDGKAGLAGVVLAVASTGKKIHRGRIQAQGGKGSTFAEESEPWDRTAADGPPTKNEGVVMVRDLRAKLKKPQEKARSQFLNQAAAFIQKLPPNGITSKDLKTSKSFPKKSRADKHGTRVDIEVDAGRAFIDD